MHTAASAAAWLPWGGSRPQEACAAEGDAKEALRQDYDKFSSTYDELDGGVAAGVLGLERERASMIGSASGLVLEVAVGTGLNLPMYKFRQAGRGKVDKLVAIDLSTGMLSQARSKSASLKLDEAQIELKVMDVEKLEFPDATFDTVVDTFSLCVFQDPVAALREMKRVCKPGGRILLLENSISDNGLLAAYQVQFQTLRQLHPPSLPSPLFLCGSPDVNDSIYQKATAPLVAKVGGKGCFYDQDPAALLKAAGIKVLVDLPLVTGGVLRRIEAVV